MVQHFMSGENRRLANAKSSMLQEINPDAASILLSICDSARTWFAALCSGDCAVLCFAVLCCAVLAVLL